MQFSLASAIEGDEGTYAIEGHRGGPTVLFSLFPFSLSPREKAGKGGILREKRNEWWRRSQWGGRRRE